MTHSPPPTTSLRHVLVVDEAAVEWLDEHSVERLADRLSPIRDETVVIAAGADPAPGRIEPDYAVVDGGERIVRVQTGATVEDWPPEDAPASVSAAVHHLAAALLVAPSEIYLVTTDAHVEGVEEENIVRVGPGEEVDVDFAAGLDRLRMFGRTHPAVSDVTEEAFYAAHGTLRRNLTPIGFTAASLTDNRLAAHDANYAAVWARDGIITGLWSLCLDDPELDACFAATLRLLARHQTPSGQVPAYVRIAGEVPDYSGIGGIASIDSVLWFVIGAVRFAFHTGDRSFAEEMRVPVERAMAWLAAHDANNDGLLEIPESADWMDLFPRSYNVLHDEVLWYEACRHTGVLLAALGDDGSGWTDHSRTVADRIGEMFWTTGEQLVEVAGTSGGRFSAGEGHYLLSQVTPFDYGWRCDVLANLLASLAGLLSEERSERLFQFLWGVGINEPFPVRALYPAVSSGAEDWKDYFLVNFLNLPDHYHNGGVWPLIGGVWVRFLARIGRVELAHRELQTLAESCRVGIHGEWEFNEWLHGQTGRPMGKAHQAWSAASYVAAYTALNGDGDPRGLGPLDPSLLTEPSST